MVLLPAAQMVSQPLKALALDLFHDCLRLAAPCREICSLEYDVLQLSALRAPWPRSARWR
eukprot:5422510-Prymnesium_polylepis.1